MFESTVNENLTICDAVGDGSTVLVAEGDVETRRMVCDVLEVSGFRVVAAIDSAETLRLFSECKPDIVILDCAMPGLSGVELCRILRQEGVGSQVPILLTTLNVDHDLIVKGFDAGATDFIPLPFNWSLLPYRVSYLLRAHHVSLQLSQSENRQHTLFEGIPDPLLIYDRDCSVVWANRSSSVFLQNQHSALVGKCCYEIWGRENTCCDVCDIVRCFDSGKVITGTRRSSDGKVWGVRLLPIENEDGEISNVVKLAHDITEKIKLQTEATRTSQMAVIGELAAGVAHEINNPIHGVINYAQILMNKGNVAGSDLDLVERIQREGERIAKIVQGLLSFSSPATAELSSEDIIATLDESINLFSSKLKSNHIHLQITRCDGSHIVQVRKNQLQQVFVNLISNARHALNSKRFDDPAGKSLKVDVERTLYNEQSMLAIAFLDRGCGIPGDLLPRVMQPFVTTKSAGHGTGLGLSISDNIMREHGGHLNIESTEGEYTKVTLLLPLAG